MNKHDQIEITEFCLKCNDRTVHKSFERDIQIGTLYGSKCRECGTESTKHIVEKPA